MGNHFLNGPRWGIVILLVLAIVGAWKWTGPHSTNPCVSNPCQNGGVCNAAGTCDCVGGYSGSNCATEPPSRSPSDSTRCNLHYCTSGTTVGGVKVPVQGTCADGVLGEIELGIDENILNYPKYEGVDAQRYTSLSDIITMTDSQEIIESIKCKDGWKTEMPDGTILDHMVEDEDYSGSD